jgi:hypothetical protein
MDDQFKSEENQTPKNENFNPGVSNGLTEEELEAANLDTEPLSTASADQSLDNASSSSGPSFSFQSGDKSKTKVVEKQTIKEKPIAQSPEPNSTTDKPKSGKKRALIIILIVLLIIGSAFAWFLLKSDKAEPPQGTVNQDSVQNQQESTKEKKPYGVVNAITSDAVNGDCNTVDSKLFLSSLEESATKEAVSLGSSYVTWSDIKDNIVVLVSASSCGTEGELVWYSTDSGESYEKIYTAKKAESAEALAEQITSVEISSDSKSVVINSFSSQFSSTVKEIDLSSKEVKDLFSVEQKAVFVNGYDKAKNNIYYFVGCYNCDGNAYNKLYVRNLNDDKEEVVFEHDRIGFQTIINDDFTKILVNKATPGEGLGGGAPFDVEEFDIQGKTFKNLKTITENGTVLIGYTEKQEQYYTNQSKITKIVEDGTEIIVYEAPKPILRVFIVSENQVIVSEGEYNEFEVNNYNTKDKSTKQILSGSEKTQTFGVTWK